MSQDKKLYLSSMMYAYLLAFVVINPVVMVFEGKPLSAGLVFFGISLMVGVPVGISAYILGYPMFELLQKNINANYLASVFISGLCVALAVSGLGVVVLSIVFDLGLDGSINLVYLVLGSTMGVATLAAAIFWYRTK